MPSIAEYEEMATAKLPARISAFYATGTGNEQTAWRIFLIPI